MPLAMLTMKRELHSYGPLFGETLLIRSPTGHNGTPSIQSPTGHKNLHSVNKEIIDQAYIWV